MSDQECEYLYERGVEALESGDLDAAIRQFNEIIRLNREHAGAFFQRGVARSRKRELEIATPRSTAKIGRAHV